MRQKLRTSFAWLVISSVSIAHAGDLDANQRKVLASLTSYVAQIETNVKLAEEAAGPGEGRPPEAKIRLVRTRLAQPQSMLPQVRQELDKLPADHADVTALRERLDAVGKKIAMLETRIGGTPPPPTSSGAKLDYKQEKALADEDFPAEGRGEARRILLDAVLRIRREDGSFCDFPPAGPAYGTAMALEALDLLRR
jgi:hypothetical protein